MSMADLIPSHPSISAYCSNCMEDRCSFLKYILVMKDYICRTFSNLFAIDFEPILTSAFTRDIVFVLFLCEVY